MLSICRTSWNRSAQDFERMPAQDPRSHSRRALPRKLPRRHRRCIPPGRSPRSLRLLSVRSSPLATLIPCGRKLANYAANWKNLSIAFAGRKTACTKCANRSEDRARYSSDNSQPTLSTNSCSASAAQGVPGCSLITRLRYIRAFSAFLLSTLLPLTPSARLRTQVVLVDLLKAFPCLIIARILLYPSIRLLAARIRPIARSNSACQRAPVSFGRSDSPGARAL